MSTEARFAHVSFGWWVRYFGTHLLILLLIFLVAQSAILYRDNRRLRATIAGASSRSVGVKVGNAISSLSGRDEVGKPVNLDLRQGRRLLLVYRHNCKFCSLNFPNWKELESQVGEMKVSYVALGDSDHINVKYASDQKVIGRTLFMADVNQARKLGFDVTPQTMLVEDGRVTSAHAGVLSKESMTELKAVKEALNAEAN